MLAIGWYVRGMHFRFRQWLTSEYQVHPGSRAGRLGLGRFRTEGPRRVALRPRRPGELALACQLPGPLFLVVRARQRREESNEVINISLLQGERLDVLVEIGILQTGAL